ncbi:unnamed protein product, partial [Sphacelaria rigidula]
SYSDVVNANIIDWSFEALSPSSSNRPGTTPLPAAALAAAAAAVEAQQHQQQLAILDLPLRALQDAARDMRPIAVESVRGKSSTSSSSSSAAAAAKKMRAPVPSDTNLFSEMLRTILLLPPLKRREHHGNSDADDGIGRTSTATGDGAGAGADLSRVTSGKEAKTARPSDGTGVVQGSPASSTSATVIAAAAAATPGEPRLRAAVVSTAEIQRPLAVGGATTSTQQVISVLTRLLSVDCLSATALATRAVELSTSTSTAPHPTVSSSADKNNKSNSMGSWPASTLPPAAGTPNVTSAA